MTLLSAWALAGLLVTIPVVLLHLRRSRPTVRDVSSLLPWRELASAAPSSTRRLGRPLLPLLLLLQLIALVALVLSLAQPASGLEAPPRGRIYVLDDSLWMGRREAGVERLALARGMLSRELRGLKAGTRVQIVLAGATPSLLYSGPAQEAARALGSLRAGHGEVELADALRFAAGLRRTRGEAIVLLHAPEDSLPTVSAPPGGFHAESVGRRFPYQALTGADARCGLPASVPCEAFVSVVNSTAEPQLDRVSVFEAAREEAHEEVSVAAHSRAAMSFLTPPGRALTLKLEGSAAFAPYEQAFVAVPAVRSVAVTLVGEPAHAEALARALEADPEVKLRLLTPSQYEARDAGESELLVLDGWLPAGALPPTASLLLVSPPELPGGTVSGTLRDSRLSGSDPTSGLLAGVDLESLTIFAHGARLVVLPSWMQALAWSPEGPLLAAGSLGGERIAMLAFEPSASNLPQLAAFPDLLSNLVSWSQEFAPAEAGAGQQLLIQQPPSTSATGVSPIVGGPGIGRLAPGAFERGQPGLYTVTEQGAWGTRSQTIAVNASAATQSPRASTVELYGPVPGGSPTRTRWWPWVLAGALVVLVLEWIYGTRRRVRTALS